MASGDNFIRARASGHCLAHARLVAIAGAGGRVCGAPVEAGGATGSGELWNADMDEDCIHEVHSQTAKFGCFRPQFSHLCC